MGEPKPKRDMSRRGNDERTPSGKTWKVQTPRAEDTAAPTQQPLQTADMCGARKPDDRKPCHKRKGWGTDHVGFGTCKFHGGSTTAGKIAAAREMGKTFMDVYKSQFRFGGNRNDPDFRNMSPETALLEEVRRSAAMVRFLEERIALWNLSQDAYTTIEQFAGLKSTPGTGNELTRLRNEALKFIKEANNPDSDQPTHLPELTRTHPQTGVSSFTDAREWLYLYREERGHLARVSKMAIDSGIANRLVTLAEDQGRILSQALRAVLSALNLTPEQELLIPQIVPPILRAVASDQKIPDISSLLPASPITPAEQAMINGR